MEYKSLKNRTHCHSFSDKVFDKDGKLVNAEFLYYTYDQNGKKLRPNILDVDPLPSAIRNASGFVMNDIMAFEEVESESVARSILQRLKLRKGDGSPFDSVFVDDKGTLTDDGRSLFESVIPQHWSSPAEFVRAQKKLAEISFNKYQRLQAKRAAQAKQNIEFNNDDAKTND